MRNLFDKNLEYSSCGVGFITNKHSVQTHTLLEHAHQALCEIPHRGGFSAEGIGDGAGVNIDLSVNFFRHLTGNSSLTLGEFGVANFFYPRDPSQHEEAEKIIREVLATYDLDILLWRDVAVDYSALNEKSAAKQLKIHQLVFARPANINNQADFEKHLYDAVQAIEAPAFDRPELEGFYPLSMSSRTQVYKGRLNSWEVIPYFKDLSHPEHHIHTLFFHTRFSTNTAPNAMFAQPFRHMAHNGELNTDRKNRLSEQAIASSHNKRIVFPKGQSDSARLDQTMSRRLLEDNLPIDTAALVMMPPAWENDGRIQGNVRDMLEYFSLYEEKNDGPAALIFSDGTKVGARLDRLGLRPLRSVETEDYLAVMSEAGQIDFPADEVIRRGRIEAGGMIVFDHTTKKIEYTNDVLARLADEADYSKLLDNAHIDIDTLPAPDLSDLSTNEALNVAELHVAYSLNQESFKFMLDPMMQGGKEKISAMGYGLAINALTNDEGGMSHYFSQRFAQVTNPPLDSIREADGMTLRVALGRKPNFSDGSTKQLVIQSPVLQPHQWLQIQQQSALKVACVEMLYKPDSDNAKANEASLLTALESLCDQVESLARDDIEIIVLSDQEVSQSMAAIPALLAVSAANQRLIKQGLRFHASLVMNTGQASSTHDIACMLGFGASAVYPASVYHRATELYNSQAEVVKGFKNFCKGAEKALMKTMGKFGLCTVESYIGGEFFEANFLDTQDEVLRQIFPNIQSPVGGARFANIAQSAASWHAKVQSVKTEKDIPLLGLFKERSDGAGHTFGTTAVREFIHMTEEPIQYSDVSELDEKILVPNDKEYRQLGYDRCSESQIDNFTMTSAYRQFINEVYAERKQRPAALRDVLALPLDLSQCESKEDFIAQFGSVSKQGNAFVAVRGITIEWLSDQQLSLSMVPDSVATPYGNLSAAIESLFKDDVSSELKDSHLILTMTGDALRFFKKLIASPSAIDLSQVQPAHEITASLASGAMSHGALVAKAHEAVAQGINIVGGMSNSGEGGENSKRYNSLKASKIKQFASGRFGVWVGYLADPSLQEIEIKIAQGAKPGEGGQLPSAKVTVEIAAARGGTPGVELVSPPPHHDTYSIEDLGQLIHDAKAARVRVIVKLVSSEGVGTIAVGVAKAGADVINIAGNTGGTGAAQVTSLKNSGRAAELGIVEVHQALSENGLRDSVILRCSNSHQTGMDVVKSAMMGGDSFEFGTTALMMLKCVMAKNCNVKCPAGLTTNAEAYDGDPRALSQFFINLAHEVREILASIGFQSLRKIRGRTDLLHLIDHPDMNGQLDMLGLLTPARVEYVPNAVTLQADFSADTAFIESVEAEFFAKQLNAQVIDGPRLNNRNKTTGGQFSVDIERHLNYTLSDTERAEHPAIDTLSNGRHVLREGSLTVNTHNSAGQSFGAFNNSGISLYHRGTCNDGVGKGASGGRIVVLNAGGGTDAAEGNVLVGNFALFGATGGELFVQGQAGDRFGVRNSGAVAVVEGVGDFCCEYMTNGAIVNLGSYGKGLGNGMSGGTAFQYDPSGQIAEQCSQDSVMVNQLTDDSALMQGYEQALTLHLSLHVTHTGSALAKSLLDDWEKARQHFYVLIPRALYNYHCSDAILANSDRKSLIEELSQAWGTWHLKRIAKAYFSNNDLFDGKLPSYGERDTKLICQYINAMGILRRALALADSTDKVTNHGVDRNTMARHLIEAEDRKLLELLFKDVKAALADYSDEALAALLADKRVRDYKESFERREVWDTRAWGTTVWIIERDRANLAEMGQAPALEEKLASQYTQLLADMFTKAA